LYSSSGMDLMGIMERVVRRPNPVIDLAPVDFSSAFTVVEDDPARDFPIIYASETFERLTGYHNDDIVGRNCRFLQSPDGLVAAGSRRK
ncbi:hypothetical protein CAUPRSCDRAFT_435, partial [Caulochytrium protostelioides]